MKIKMKEGIAGVTWSAKVGDVVEVPPAEGNRLIASGAAELFLPVFTTIGTVEDASLADLAPAESGTLLVNETAVADVQRPARSRAGRS